MSFKRRIKRQPNVAVPHISGINPIMTANAGSQTVITPTAVGAAAPVTWSLTGGASLPANVTFDSGTGAITVANNAAVALTGGIRLSAVDNNGIALAPVIFSLAVVPVFVDLTLDDTDWDPAATAGTVLCNIGNKKAGSTLTITFNNKAAISGTTLVRAAVTAFPGADSITIKESYPNAVDHSTTFPITWTASGGARPVVNVANGTALLAAINAAAGDEIIRLTTDGGNYGNLSLSNKTFFPGIDIEYIQGGARPIIETVNFSSNVNGVTFRGIRIQPQSGLGKQLVRINSGCQNILFEDVEMLGRMTWNPTTKRLNMFGAGISGSNPIDSLVLMDGRSSRVHDIQFQGVYTHGCGNGINMLNCYNITINNCSFGENGGHFGDGIDFGGNGTHDISITNCYFTDFYHDPGAHQDCIQGQCISNTVDEAGVMYNITVTDCQYDRGNGHAAQGVPFLGADGTGRNTSKNPQNLDRYRDVTIKNIQNNGGQFNGVACDSGTNVTIVDVQCQPFSAPDPFSNTVTGCGITMLNTLNGSITNSEAGSYSGFAPNVVGSGGFVVNSGNLIIPPI